MHKDILLLEDDLVLGETLKDLLESEGYALTWVRNGAEAADESYENRYDLYVFDINVPEIDGIELLEGLRDASDKTPTIFISAQVDLDTISKGFGAGADDYLKKPFYPEELLFRVKAKLMTRDKLLHSGEITYDPSSREVRKNGSIISLGSVQSALLDLFMTHAGQVVDKSLLLDCLDQPSDTGLRVAINKLKQTTGLDIKNVRAVGYTLETR